MATYAIKYKASISDTTSAFNSYTNAYSISKIQLPGFKGLSYLKYQYDKLNDFRMNNPSMKILISVDLKLKEKDGDSLIIKTRTLRRLFCFKDDSDFCAKS